MKIFQRYDVDGIHMRIYKQYRGSNGPYWYGGWIDEDGKRHNRYFGKDDPKKKYQPVPLKPVKTLSVKSNTGLLYKQVAKDQGTTVEELAHRLIVAEWLKNKAEWLKTRTKGDIDESL